MKATRRVGVVWIIIVVALTALIQAAQPPTPHSITGYVLENGGLTQAPEGLSVRILNQDRNYITEGETGGPTGNPGYFSLKIDGLDGDSLTLRAWNATAYGELNITLDKSMDINLTLNRTRPPELNLSIVTPNNDSRYNMTARILFNVSVMVLGGQEAKNCSFSLSFNDSVLRILGSETHNYSQLSYGTHFYEAWFLVPHWIGATNVSVNGSCDTDTLAFYNLSFDLLENITIEDPIPPNVTLISPANGSYKNVSSIEFIYNVSDHLNLSNCSIVINNTYSDFDVNIENQELNNFSTTLDDGIYIWNITCYDMADNMGFNGSFWVTVDTARPLIKNITPMHSADYNYTDTINFYANVTDNYNVSEVWVNISWNGTTQSFRMSALAGVDSQGNGRYHYAFDNTTFMGDYNFTMVARDGANNTNTSTLRYFTVYGIDLEINQSSLLFDTEAVEFSRVELTTRVYKSGNKNGTNVNVSFYEGGYASGTLINWTTFNVSSESYVDVAVNWTAKMGSWLIEAVVDADFDVNGTIQEINESNNNASKNITVKAYHVFFGNASYNVVLDTQLKNKSLMSWQGGEAFSGNMYAADGDSNVNWNQLLALSRDTSGDYVAGSFGDLDTELNMTSLDDSIVNTYTSGGLPLATRNFQVFNSTISNVPVVNSTNSESFITGILWDYSDGGSYYDGSQDVVFVTNFNYSSLGKYGLYDYELRVPARLREYVSPNLVNTIDLFVEII